MFATHELQVIPVTFMKHFSSSSSSSAATRFSGNFTRRPLDPDVLAFPFTMRNFLVGDLDPDDEAGLISGMVRTVWLFSKENEIEDKRYKNGIDYN